MAKGEAPGPMAAAELETDGRLESVGGIFKVAAETEKDCEHVLKVVGSVPTVVRDACLARGWSLWDEETMHASHWHLCWRNGGFKPSEIHSANGVQRINHFLKSSVIKRKDTLERALRKLRGVHGSIYNFSPDSFILPGEYTKFVHEYSKQERKQIWICKPSNSSRGRKSECDQFVRIVLKLRKGR